MSVWGAFPLPRPWGEEATLRPVVGHFRAPTGPKLALGRKTAPPMGQTRLLELNCTPCDVGGVRHRRSYRGRWGWLGPGAVRSFAWRADDRPIARGDDYCVTTSPHMRPFLVVRTKKKLFCFRGQLINFLGCCTASRRPEGAAARGRSVLGGHKAKLGLFCF